jgi:trimeric autotransporter adhesin
MHSLTARTGLRALDGRAVAAIAAALSLLLAIAFSSRPPVLGGSSSGGEAGAGAISLAESRAIGAEDPAYPVGQSHGSLVAANSAQHLRLSFGAAGVHVIAPRMEVGLRLQAAGYGNVRTLVTPARPTVQANRVSYSHGALQEWYANGPRGLEQGFTIAHAPDHATGPLTLVVGVIGGARASLDAGGRSATLRASGGTGALGYGGLSAQDAAGDPLGSSMAVEHGKLVLRVDAAGARYPVTVDPAIEERPELPTVTPPEGNESGRFGSSVALSSDGNTALIGAPKEDGGAGAAWIFSRADGVWDQKGQQVTMPAGETEAGDCGRETPQEEEEDGEPGETAGAELCRFGLSVALSGDGSLAAIGAPHADHNNGGVWLWLRSGSTWTPGPELTSPVAGETLFGRSVAVSSDGNTVLVGAPMFRGRAWVFTRTGSTWTAAGTPLVGGSLSSEGGFGSSVALSADGQTALIGAPSYGGLGAAWVFHGSGAAWSAPGTRIATAGGESAGARFGLAVALSGDGQTALVGSRLNESDIGAAWVFTEAAGSWTQQGPMLTGTGEAGETGEMFGSGVALSFDGDSALVGAAHYEGGHGRALLFEREGGDWGSPRFVLRAGATRRSGVQFGSGVALSATAETRLVGGRADEGSGAAWVFGTHPAVESVKPSSGPLGGGTTVTIAGEHLAEAAVVRFGSSEAASFTVNSGQSITAVSPPGSAGPVDVTVETPAGVSAKTSADTFTYTTRSKEEQEMGEGRGGGRKNEGENKKTNSESPNQSGDRSSGGGSGAALGPVVLPFGPTSVHACGVSLLSKKIVVQSHSRALFKLRGAGVGSCRGKLRLRVKLELSDHRTTLKTIGTAVFAIGSGKTVSVKVKLNSAGRRVLSAGHGHLNGSVLIVKSLPLPQQARIASVKLSRAVVKKR